MFSFISRANFCLSLRRCRSISSLCESVVLKALQRYSKFSFAVSFKINELLLRTNFNPPPDSCRTLRIVLAYVVSPWPDICRNCILGCLNCTPCNEIPLNSPVDETESVMGIIDPWIPMSPRKVQSLAHQTLTVQSVWAFVQQFGECFARVACNQK